MENNEFTENGITEVTAETTEAIDAAETAETEAEAVAEASELTNEDAADAAEDEERERRRTRELHVIGEAKKFLTDLLPMLGFDCLVEERPKRDELCYFIKGESAHNLIGYRGETLDALQYLATQVAKQTGCSYERVVIDADFYRQRRQRTLTALAERLARKAYQSGKEVKLEPMNPAERRIIHSALQESRYATTHSEGEGRDRHIVVTPKEKTDEPEPIITSAPAAEEEVAYGYSDFKKKGFKKTRSFGNKRRKF